MNFEKWKRNKKPDDGHLDVEKCNWRRNYCDNFLPKTDEKRIRKRRNLIREASLHMTNSTWFEAQRRSNLYYDQFGILLSSYCDGKYWLCNTWHFIISWLQWIYSCVWWLFLFMVSFDWLWIYESYQCMRICKTLLYVF